jgi:hypothetical protein
MQNLKFVCFFTPDTVFFAEAVQGSGKLQGPIHIASATLGYDLQYRQTAPRIVYYRWADQGYQP